MIVKNSSLTYRLAMRLPVWLPINIMAVRVGRGPNCTQTHCEISWRWSKSDTKIVPSFDKKISLYVVEKVSMTDPRGWGPLFYAHDQLTTKSSVRWTSNVHLAYKFASAAEASILAQQVGGCMVEPLDKYTL